MKTGPTLQPGESVFVSVAASCDFYPNKILQELKLVPLVYKGLYELPNGRTTNIHLEAKQDLVKCAVLAVIVPLSAHGKFGENVWGYRELDTLTRLGMTGFLYLPLVESISESQEVCSPFSLPAYARIRNAPNCASLYKMLKEDLMELF